MGLGIMDRNKYVYPNVLSLLSEVSISRSRDVKLLPIRRSLSFRVPLMRHRFRFLSLVQYIAIMISLMKIQ